MDEHMDPNATQRFKRVSATQDAGTHGWLTSLGDAIVDLGDRMGGVSEKLTDVRVELAGHVKRTEVASIAKAANSALEAQVKLLTNLVFGVLVVFVLGVAADVIMWAHK